MNLSKTLLATGCCSVAPQTRSKIVSRVTTEELRNGNDADVPPGYFDALADRISQRIAAEENTSPAAAKERGRVIVFAEVVKRFARPAAIAASAALLIAVSIWFLNRDTHPQQTLAKMDTAQPKTVTPVLPQQPIVQQPVKDTAQPKQEVAVQPKHPKQRLNHPVVAPVQVEKQDVMEQLDLLDENTVAAYIDNQTEEKQSIQNSELLPYIIEGNVDPSEYLNLQDKKQ